MDAFKVKSKLKSLFEDVQDKDAAAQRLIAQQAISIVSLATFFELRGQGVQAFEHGRRELVVSKRELVTEKALWFTSSTLRKLPSKLAADITLLDKLEPNVRYEATSAAYALVDIIESECRYNRLLVKRKFWIAEVLPEFLKRTAESLSEAISTLRQVPELSRADFEVARDECDQATRSAYYATIAWGGTVTEAQDAWMAMRRIGWTQLNRVRAFKPFLTRPDALFEAPGALFSLDIEYKRLLVSVVGEANAARHLRKGSGGPGAAGRSSGFSAYQRR